MFWGGRKYHEQVLWLWVVALWRRVERWVEEMYFSAMFYSSRKYREQVVVGGCPVVVCAWSDEHEWRNGWVAKH